MAIGRSLGVLSALLIGSEFAPAQEVTVPGRVIALASSLVRNHYVQAYTIDSRPDNPLRSVQVSSTDFDACADRGLSRRNCRFRRRLRGRRECTAADRAAHGRVADRRHRVRAAPPGKRSRSPWMVLPRSRRIVPCLRAAIERLPGEKGAFAASLVQRVDTVTVTKVDTVTVMRVDTVLKTKVDTVTRTRPAPAARGTAPR